jgi:hypothetical protein
MRLATRTVIVGVAILAALAGCDSTNGAKGGSEYTVEEGTSIDVHAGDTLNIIMNGGFERCDDWGGSLQGNTCMDVDF